MPSLLEQAKDLLAQLSRHSQGTETAEQISKFAQEADSGKRDGALQLYIFLQTIDFGKIAKELTEPAGDFYRMVLNWFVTNK